MDLFKNKQASAKLSARWFGLFRTASLAGGNELKLALLPYVKLHDVIHVSQTRPVIESPAERSKESSLLLDGYQFDEDDEEVSEGEKIILHNRRGRG